ncbi:ClpP/crotonase [Hymenopellis radicata]|nr:ClpP/crotonase [Hymenopellis radicata]
MLSIKGMVRPGRALQRTRAIAAHMKSTLAAADPVVRFESRGSMRIYNLSRERKLNTLTDEMLDLMRPKIQAWHDADTCGIICGLGTGRAFCAGGDVVAVAEKAANKATRGRASEFFVKEFELDFLLATLPKPYVAIMDGFTMGGGVGLSAPAQFRIATENTVWAMPEAAIGYSPDVGATYYMSRLDGELGTYLALTGAHVKGRHAFELGLATHYMSSRQIPMLLEALSGIEGINAKEIINDGQEEMTDEELQQAKEEDAREEGARRNDDDAGASPDDADVENILPEEDPANLPEGLDFFPLVNDTILQFTAQRQPEEPRTPLRGDVRVALDHSFSHDTVEAIVESLTAYARSRNAKVSTWAKDTLGLLAVQSPTSLKVALEAIRTGSTMSLRQCLETELNIAHAYCLGASPDFIEGITAKLVRKCPPVWDPPRLEEVDSTILGRFFATNSPYVTTDAPKFGLSDDQFQILETRITPFHEYGLPSEDEIEDVIRGLAPNSPSLSMTRTEVITFFTDHHKDRYEDVKDKVEEVVDRRCRIVDNSDGNYEWVAWDRGSGLLQTEDGEPVHEEFPKQDKVAEDEGRNRLLGSKQLLSRNKRVRLTRTVLQRTQARRRNPKTK